MNRKPRRLSVRWSKKEDDWLVSYPCGPDGHLAYGLIAGYVKGPEFIKELEARGYDLTTLRIVVDRRAP